MNINFTKKSLVYVFLVVFCSISCKNTNLNEPSNLSDGSIKITSAVCYFSSIDTLQHKLNIKVSLPTSRELDEITNILEYVGLPQNFKIYRGEVDNAMATIVDNNRLIVFNKDFLSRLDRKSDSYFTSMFIIAHEIGHHLAYNISDTTDFHKAELEADSFAASVLFKMGASLQQSCKAVESKFVSGEMESRTHPSKRKRVEVVTNSWTKASKLRYQSAIPPPPNDPELSEREVEDLEFFEEEFYGRDVKEVFGDIENHKEYHSNNIEGIITDVENSFYLDDNNLKIPETNIRVFITKADSLNRDLPSEQFLDMRVEFHSTVYREKEFNIFLKAGRRIKFSVVRVRPLIQYLVYAKTF